MLPLRVPPNNMGEDVLLADDQATERFGAELAATLAPGQLVLLSGDLGAGKTKLARAVIRALMGETALEFPSPSFALVQPYEKAGLSVLHADLYRLSSPHQLDELGLFDQPDAIVLVEWPERAEELLERAD